MMTDTVIGAIVRGLIARNGRYVLPGACVHGVTVDMLAACSGKVAPPVGIRQLSDDDAAAVYTHLFIDDAALDLRFWQYSRLVEVALDAAVVLYDKGGRRLVVAWVQRACNRRLTIGGAALTVNGRWDAATEAAVMRFNQDWLVVNLVGSWIRHMTAVLRDDRARLEVSIRRAAGWLTGQTT